MHSSVPAMEKRDFLKWFLDQHQLKRRECAWLLNFLMSDDILMEKVHFVEEADHCPKALIISTNDVEEIPFSFHKNHHITMDAEKAFHDIRLNRNEDIYIQLNFENKQTSHQYMAVMEENPYLPVNAEEENLNAVLAEMVLDESIRLKELERLRAEINEALQSRDKDSFHNLAKQYAALKALQE
ncbi:ReoY family proteolytic degradation factor [Salisediminibacterium halotolerans]|uniref:UPF0302 protein SAMN05444126_10152 n=1 Tax=Salisediminibacterium halotolerans TaxID=517425 RepID=A0A1H9P159_9BACI|nr:ReoY family proteolytic degradation factor [Salisediminibacterium haloalkalitolerans]SER42024.1 Uncharacterized protein YpiB, UPF0302 family [Salisediminibacterium haloalkalitolerans]